MHDNNNWKTIVLVRVDTQWSIQVHVHNCMCACVFSPFIRGHVRPMGDHVSIRYSSAPSFSYGSCYQNRDAAPAQNFTNPVTHTLQYIMKQIHGRVPRLLMFGSGLESIPLIRLMIMGNNSPYKPTGLFPGKHGMNK